MDLPNLDTGKTVDKITGKHVPCHPVKYVACCKEKSDEGTPHLHAIIQLKDEKSFSAFRKFMNEYISGMQPSWNCKAVIGTSYDRIVTYMRKQCDKDYFLWDATEGMLKAHVGIGQSKSKTCTVITEDCIE